MEDKNVNSGTQIHSPIKHSIAGTVGGLLSVTLGHPLDTVKVRLQTTTILASNQNAKFNGTLDCIRQTVRREGTMALFKGLSPHLLIAVPFSSVLFWGYGLGLKLQGGKSQKMEDLSPLQIFNAGVFAGTCVTAIVVPSFQIKCQLQVQEAAGAAAKHKGPFSLGLYLFRQRGLRGLYKGTCANLLTLPAYGSYYLSYEYIMRQITPVGGSRDQIGTLQVLLAGGLAGIIWWMVGLPADVITSRIWTAPEGTYPRGTRDVLKRMLREEGPLALYKGLTPSLLRAAPESAALFLGYELTLRFLDWIAQ